MSPAAEGGKGGEETPPVGGDDDGASEQGGAMAENGGRSGAAADSGGAGGMLAGGMLAAGSGGAGTSAQAGGPAEAGTRAEAGATGSGGVGGMLTAGSGEAGATGSAGEGGMLAAGSGEAGATGSAGEGGMLAAGSGEAGASGAAGMPPGPQLCSACGGCEEVQPIAMNIVHTDDPIDYPDPPPTSGSHNMCWATWGVHDAPTPAERWVHNLEHGGVIYLYNCPDGCAADVATLSQIVASHNRTLLTAYDKLPKRFAAVAWGHRLVTDCVDVDAYTKFYDENFDHGDESLDANPDASCPP